MWLCFCEASTFLVRLSCTDRDFLIKKHQNGYVKIQMNNSETTADFNHRALSIQDFLVFENCAEKEYINYIFIALKGGIIKLSCQCVYQYVFLSHSGPYRFCQ